ncbi:MAG TPA: HEPN domain-containing protein [Candidatus Paceibacterota bacterium]
MELAEVIDYWRRLSDEKWKTTEALMEKERYADALFFAHLSLEALLKAVVVEHTGEQAPRVHDLVKLTYLAGLLPDDEQKKQLQLINTFNIAGRYDDEKFALYKKATRDYASDHVNKADTLRTWTQNKQQ